MASGTIPQPMNYSGDGYCKMLDGTLIQWGYVEISREPQPKINESTATFPISFVGTNPVVLPTVRTRTYAPYLSVFPSDTFLNRTGFVLYNSGTTDLGTGVVYWVAIGRWK